MQPPYAHLTPTVFIAKRVEGTLSYDPKNLLPRKISKKTKKFLATLLQIEPANRPRTAKVAQEEFEKLIHSP